MIWVNEDLLKIFKESGHSMRLNENAVAAIRATTSSMKDFQVRQELVEALKKAPNSWESLFEPTEQQKTIELLIEAQREDFYNGLREKMRVKLEESGEIVLPVTMEIDGERVQIGEALIDRSGDGNYCIVHALIDGTKNVANLLKIDLGSISIGNKDDFKAKQTLEIGQDGHVVEKTE